MSLETDDPRTRAAQAADALRSEITAGTYGPGQKLPSIRELTERFGIAAETVKRALATLIEERRIFSVPNRGYFVVDPARNDAAAPADGDVLQRVNALHSELRSLAARVAELEKRSDSGDA